MSIKVKRVMCLILSLALLLGNTAFSEGVKEDKKSFETSEFVKNQQALFEKEMALIYKAAVKSSGIKHTHGMYVENLLTGECYSINGNKTRVDPSTGDIDAYFRAASVSKLPMSWALVQLVEAKKISYTKQYRDPITGRKFTVKAEIQNMLRNSNNNSFNTLLRFLYEKELMDDVRDSFRAFGLPHLNLYAEVNPGAGTSNTNNLKRYGTTKKGMVSPVEIGKLLKNIYEEKKTNPLMQDVFDGLDGNIYNSRIPAGMPSDIVVAHKTGTDVIKGIYNDAAICYTKSGVPFTLVFFTESETQVAAEGFERSVSKNVLKYMETKGLKSAKNFSRERTKYMAMIAKEKQKEADRN